MRFSNLKLSSKTLIIALIPFLAGVAFMSALWFVIDLLENNLVRERQSRDATDLSLLALTNIAQTAIVVELYGTSHEPRMLKTYQALCTETRDLLSRLRSCPVTDPDQRVSI